MAQFKWKHIARIIACTLCIPMLCISACAESYCLMGDIAISAPARWTETYQTQWRSIPVDVPVEVPKVAQFPIIKVRLMPAVSNFFCGGIWGIVSITAALYTRDKLLAIAIPFCIYFLWHYGLPSILLGIRPFPHPADLYNDALTVPMIWRSLMVYAVLLVATCGLYMSKLKRSYQHG